MESLQIMLNNLAAAAPRLAAGLAILIFGWIFARVFSGGIRKLLVKIHADKLGERLNSIDFISKMDKEIKISVILSKVLYYLILLMVIIAACDSLGLDTVSQQIQKLIDYIPQLLSAVVVLLGGALLANGVKSVLSTAMQSMGINAGRVIANAVFWFLFITVAISALAQAGIETRFIENNIHILLLGIAAAFAIGYGIASRQVLANLVAGSYSRRRFKIGDEIEIGNIKGTITHLDATAITIRNGDQEFIVPQSKFTNQTVSRKV